MLNEKYFVILDNGCEMDVDYMIHDVQSNLRASYLLDDIVEAVKYRIAYECSNQVAAEKFHLYVTRVQDAFNLYYCHKDIIKTVIDECIVHGKVQWLKYRKHQIVAVRKGDVIYNAKLNKKPSKLEQILDWSIDNFDNPNCMIDIFEDNIVGTYFTIVNTINLHYITVCQEIQDNKELLTITVEIPTIEDYEVINYKEYKTLKSAENFIEKVMEE